MRKIGLLLAVAIAPLSAMTASCAAIGPALSLLAPIAASQDKVVLQGTKGLVLAELAYNAIASTANETAKACLANPNLPCPISAQTAGTLRTLNAEAIAALNMGKAASDDVTKAKAAANVFNIVDRIKALIGR